MRDASKLPSMQQPPATPSRTPSQLAHDPANRAAAPSSNLSAALKGATLAFQGQRREADKPNAATAGTKPAPRTPNPTTRDNGAALAAAQASRDPSRSPVSASKGRQGVSKQTTGGSMPDSGQSARGVESAAVAQRLSQFLGSSPVAGSPYLLSPGGPKVSPDPKSASLIAATLAASRTGSPAPPAQKFAHAPLTQTQRHARIPRRGPSASNSVKSSSPSLEDQQPDSSSIPPTESLISMFETRRQDIDPIKKGDWPAPALGRPGLDTAPKMRPITPPREMSPRRDEGEREIEFEAREETSRRTAAQKPKLKPKPQPMAQSREAAAAADSSEMAGVDPQRITEAAERREMGSRKVEKLMPKPKPPLDEPPAHSSNEQTGFDVGREGSSWPLPTAQSQPPALKPKPQPKVPAVAPRGSARLPEPPATGQVHSEGRSERQPLAPVVSTKPKPPPPASRSRPPHLDRPVTPPQLVRRAMTELRSPQPQRIVPNPILEHPILPQRVSSIKVGGAGTRLMPEPQGRGAGQEEQTRPRPGQERDPRPTSRVSMSSDDTFVSASSTQSPRPSSPARGHDPPAPEAQRPRPSPSHTPLKPPILARASSMSATSLHSPNRLYRSSTASLSPNTGGTLALESLTSAMMASNLAASRSAANTPSRNSPVPPPPRRHNRHSPLHTSHTGGSPNRSKGGAGGAKSPGRMLQTLRAPPSLSDDEDARRRADRYRKKHLTGSKKHAHHEGSRRRWRDEVTAKERRRYEAVWASNRGLLLDRAQLEAFRLQHNAPRLGDQGLEPQDLVVNVVVRDLWSRSRLPVDELAEVWDLVDRSRVGALSKHEFVVGMWLIDQRLRGRKLPASVGPSVWESAQDMKITGPGKAGKAGKRR